MITQLRFYLKKWNVLFLNLTARLIQAMLVCFQQELDFNLFRCYKLRGRLESAGGGKAVIY